MAYSEDLRSRVLADVAQGDSKPTVAARYRVGLSTVYLWCQTPEQTRPQLTGPKGPWKVDSALLKQRIAARPDSYQRELAKALGVTQPAICLALKRIKLTRKKNDALPRVKRRVSQGVSATDTSS